VTKACRGVPIGRAPLLEDDETLLLMRRPALAGRRREWDDLYEATTAPRRRIGFRRGLPSNEEGDMPAITKSIDISRAPADVFSYVTDPTHLPEWQESAVSVRRIGDTPLAVGSKVAVTRRLGKREFTSTMQVIELEPPRHWHVHGIDGPVRGDVQGTIEPLEDGERSRLTLSLDFEGHGIGKALVPLVVRPHVRKEMPRDEMTLKGILESGTAG
jgi:uncharacterized protein YndB with AHSA1/START domain